MTAFLIARRLAVCVPLALFSVGGIASAASARATTGTFYNQETVTAPDVSLCTGLTGTYTNTVTVSGRFVDTGDTFHFSETMTQDYRTDWSDGSYLISHSPTHIAYNDNNGGFVYTEVQQDRGTLYDADGAVIGYQTVHSIMHTTWRDLDGNGEPEADEITANVEHARVSCR